MKEVIAISYRTCSIDGCTNKHDARGYCSTHYGRYRRYGDPLYEREKANSTICSVELCERLSRRAGMCGKHYQRLLRHGDVHYVKPRKLTSRVDFFNSRTVRVGECLIWNGTLNDDGYGRIHLGNSKYRLAHRWIWEKNYGEIPANMLVDHTCHTPSCVEIAHLRLATKSQNAQNRRGATAASSTGVRGVQWRDSHRKYSATVQSKGHSVFLGYFDTIEEAAVVAEQARKDLLGDFAGRG